MSSPASVSIERARDLQWSSRPDDAITEYDRVIEVAPGSAEAHVGRGYALFDAGRHEEAFAAIGRAGELCRRAGRAQLAEGLEELLGQMRQDAGRSAAARRWNAERRARAGFATPRRDREGDPAPSPDPPLQRPAPLDGPALAALPLAVDAVMPLRESGQGPLSCLRLRGIHRDRAWRVLRDAVGRTGWWPLLVDENAGPWRIEAFLRRNEAAERRTPAELLAAAAARPFRHTDAVRRIETLIDEDPDDGGELLFSPGEWTAAVAERETPAARGDGPGPGPDGTVCLLMVPTAVPWHVPALVRFSDHPDAGPVDRCVAAVHHWNDRHGAEPLAVGTRGNALDLHVARPPATAGEAFAVAQESWAFCEEGEASYHPTLTRFAASLLDRPVWRFHWG